MNHDFQTNEVQILLVEDDEIDVELIQRALARLRIANPIHVVSDGMLALERLRGSDRVPRIKRPYLIILDLNMPRMNGIEFLEELRQDSDLHDSICFVLTTSDADRDKVAAYEKHIAGYLVKSKVGEDFLELVDMMEHYWRLIEFPPPR